MHLEILVEDSSGRCLLETLVPKVIGEFGQPHTWRLIDYKGIGRLPADLKSTSDPAKRVLLDRLPTIIRGYSRTPGIDGVLVLIDCDRRDCKTFLRELKAVVADIEPAPQTIFRLAIEEMEAWYLGDRPALLSRYPRTKRDVLERYVQDSICDTWETLADAIHPGGSRDLKKHGYPLIGDIKHSWAERIGPAMDPQRNSSPSFNKFKEALIRLVGMDDGGDTAGEAP